MAKLFTRNMQVVFAVFMTAFSAQSKPFSFEDAWVVLQDKNNSLAAERSNVQRYQHLEEAKQDLGLPTVTLGAKYVRLDDDISIDLLDISPTFAALGLDTLSVTDRDIVSSSIRIVWPIFTGFRITAAQEISAQQTQEAVANLAMEKQARYEDLAKYYFSVVLAKEVLATHRSVERGLTQHRDFAIKLEQQGQIARVERLQAEASLDKAIVDRKKSQKNLDIAIVALTQILNQSEVVVPQSHLFINDDLPPASTFTNKTLNSYPGLAILDAKEQQAENLIIAEKGKYYPEVYLFGDYSVYDDDSFSLDLSPEWYVGVGVNVPLFENSGRGDNMKAAYSAVLQVQHLRLQAKQDLTILVKKTYLEAEQAMEEARGLDSSLALAQENLKLRKKAFNQGLSTSLEVVDAELYLASIKTQQQMASFNYLISLNKLLALSSEMTSFSDYENNAFESITAEESA